MCDFGISAIVMTALSTVASVGGSIMQANAAADAADYNAQVAEMNAQIADENAKDALERGQDEEQQKRYQVAKIKADQEAGMAANGLDTGYGSALNTMVETAYLGELDALTIRSNSNREAYNYNVEGANQRSQAQLYKMESSSARTGGYLAATGTFLGGMSKASGQAHNYQNSVGSIS